MDPQQHYRTYQKEYDWAWERTAATGRIFGQVAVDTRQDLLDQAVRFGLLSTQTKVRQQEQAYTVSLEMGSASALRDRIHNPDARQLNSDSVTPPSTFNTAGWRDNYGEEVFTRALAAWEDMAETLRAAGVNYANNKAAYIVRNCVEPDYETIFDQWDDGAYDQVHRRIAEEFLGVGLSKGAYAMGKLGCAEKLCIDRHVASAAGIASEDLYRGPVVERYEEQCDRVEAAFPDLSELPRPIFRWIVFDAHRYAARGEPPVTTHDVLFDSVPDLDEVEAVNAQD